MPSGKYLEQTRELLLRYLLFSRKKKAHDYVLLRLVHIPDAA